MADWYTPTGEVAAAPLFEIVEGVMGNDATWTPSGGEPEEIRGTLQQTVELREYFVEGEVSAFDSPETFAVRAAAYSLDDFPAPIDTDTYGTLVIHGKSYAVQGVLAKQSYIFLFLSQPQ